VDAITRTVSSPAPLSVDAPAPALPTEKRKIAELMARQSVILKALDATSDAIYLVDRTSMAIVYINDAACSLHNMTREQLIAGGPSGALQMPTGQIEKVLDAIIARGTPSEPVEIMRPRKDGRMGCYELRRHPVFAGGRWLIVSLVRDITQAKLAQTRIVHLNRVYTMLTDISSLIVRVRTREELFDTACRIAGKEGGFPMTLIAMLDRATNKLIPVASYGMPSDVLAGLTKRFASTEAHQSGPQVGQTMAERAVRERKVVLNNDLAANPNAIYAKRYVKAGIHAMAMLPLVVGGEAVGVMALYSTQVNFFHGEELKLLLNLTQDIAFAVDHIDKQDRLAYLACYDVLTGLANRTLFLDRVTQYLHSATKAGHRLVVYLADVERFKTINDSLGQGAGDALLQQIGAWITHTAGGSNVVARVGSNHFAIVRPEVRGTDDLEALLEGQLKNFSSHPFRLNDQVFRISIKAGAAVFPADGNSAATLYKNAEAALKKAKMRGEPYLFYTESMTRRTSGKLSLESELRQALDRQEFVLHYQPKINLATGKLTSTEALLRWNKPASGLIAPGYFVPILEETGLIHDVGRWVLRQALSDYLRWQASKLTAVRIAVNVSQLQLRQRGFIDEISRVVGSESAANGLEIEITESVLMADVKHSITTLQAIRDLGVTIAIDDFGTGFSSLSYLAKLPLDTLKVDRSFVVDMESGAQGLALVSTIVTLAHALKLKVVAEGVETDEQARLLHQVACDEMQGFLISKALPCEEFEARYLSHLP
jgi:diguanylate cyclase (GGDEF)-like protein/PAS domain S-box-containing protein